MLHLQSLCCSARSSCLFNTFTARVGLRLQVYFVLELMNIEGSSKDVQKVVHTGNSLQCHPSVIMLGSQGTRTGPSN